MTNVRQFRTLVGLEGDLADLLGSLGVSAPSFGWTGT
jgi:hypothetical protein